MLVRKTSQRQWTTTDYPGIDRALFRHNDAGGRSSVVRLGVGCRFPRHAHKGDEEVLVLQGSVRIGGQDLGAGDYLYTDAGAEHDVLALEDAIIFVSSQKQTPVIE